MSSNRPSLEGPFQDGRDELNLADFPISVLQRQQPLDEDGAKRDTAVYQASRYDREARQRQQQRVTLETSSRHGLPTPADENVVLALLYLAKHSHNFTEPVVRFSPRQLFKIMGWAPNSRSYDRLREVLRRLQALVIRYENSWWDIAGRGYEAEVATGIISEYELGRQVAGRKKGAAPPSCWVSWSPRFQQSLASGNLKKLDLERLFSLRLPTAQRMYRFLDKRFYPPHQPPVVEMDLVDFACGHIGLSQVDNVAELKRRLNPAIRELEGIGFIDRADPAERYQKVRPGVWRVRFRAGPALVGGGRWTEDGKAKVCSPSTVHRPPSTTLSPSPVKEQALAAEFYRAWGAAEGTAVGERDLEQARALLTRHGEEAARALLPELVRIVKHHWPECKSFSGAVHKYGADAACACEQKQRSGQQQQQAQARLKQEREQAQRDARQRCLCEARWEALGQAERAEIEQQVLTAHPELRERPAILRVLCLNQMTAGEVP
ncbi:MAG: replication initiator protein A [Gemmataceae bacterium]|nr:replication initiator protein A [Gemmataceae bacterium]